MKRASLLRRLLVVYCEIPDHNNVLFFPSKRTLVLPVVLIVVNTVHDNRHAWSQTTDILTDHHHETIPVLECSGEVKVIMYVVGIITVLR